MAPDPSDRVAAVEANLDELLARPRPPDAPPLLDGEDEVCPGFTVHGAMALFEDMVRSRVLDVVGREMKSRGEGFYTISSAGHEFNALVGMLTRPTDPALLHYRSGAFVMARSRRAARESGEARNPLRDTLSSLAASSLDPASGGRHKVWGSRADWIIPQTSTIGSHPPKATGMAFAIDLARRVGHDLEIPGDSIVVCSFGDASANHATTLSGINAARYSKRRGAPTPILFVCEDNGLGISVPTPRGWIADSYGQLSHLTYRRADGGVPNMHQVVGDAIDEVRSRRAPVFLHLPTVRLWGHAGSDVEATYRSRDEVRRDEDADPLLTMAGWLLDTGAASPETLRRVVSWTRTQVRSLAVEVGAEPHLASAAQVMASLGGTDGDLARQDAADAAAAVRSDPDARRGTFGGTLPEEATQPVKRTMAAHLGAALTDAMLARPEVLVLGEDIGRKGGVYGVTGRLQQAFGHHRVFDTLLDETTVLGTAQGAGLLGYLPVPEIQYLAYLHNAIDQLRGEAASTSFFSDGQFATPMVVRVAGLAYQKGFGGHFHNDNAIAALREIPGIVVAVPSRGDDAVRMLRGCLAVAKRLHRVCVFLEPIALYHERDLHAPGDGGWLTDHPGPDEVLFPGEVGTHDELGREGGGSLLLVTWGNGVRMSRRVARRLAEERGANVRVLDLRWLLPYPAAAVQAHAEAAGNVLVVDEARASGGIADTVISHLVEGGFRGPIASVRSADSYVPLGPAADTVLLGESHVMDAAASML